MIYARKVKDIMLKAMPHTTDSESGFRDVREYDEQIQNLMREERSDKSSEETKKQ